MKRYFYQNTEVGFKKWCKNVAKIRYIIKRYRDLLSPTEKERLKEEYKEALISHEQYLALMRMLSKEEQEYFNKYLVTNKIPPREYYSREISGHIYLLWRTILFTDQRKIKKMIE